MTHQPYVSWPQQQYQQPLQGMYNNNTPQYGNQPYQQQQQQQQFQQPLPPNHQFENAPTSYSQYSDPYLTQTPVTYQQQSPQSNYPPALQTAEYQTQQPFQQPPPQTSLQYNGQPPQQQPHMTSPTQYDPQQTYDSKFYPQYYNSERGTPLDRDMPGNVTSPSENLSRTSSSTKKSPKGSNGSPSKSKKRNQSPQPSLSTSASKDARNAQRARPTTTTGRRIDSSQVPSPHKDLMQENASQRILFNTSSGVPPYGVTNFTAIDDGNASPKYMRPTMTAPVHDKSYLAETALQVSLVLSPLQEKQLNDPRERVPIVSGRPPVRCGRCRAYLSPNASTFVDLGRRWHCHICDMMNDTSDDFFVNLDSNNRRLDYFEKPELSRGSVEYDVSNIENYFYTNPTTQKPIPPKPLHHLFLIDISNKPQIRDSLTDLVDSLRRSLQRMSHMYPECKVSFITYASSLHFYNFSNPLVPQMIVADTDTPFVPLPFTLLCWMELGEELYKIEDFLNKLPQLAHDCGEEKDCALGAAVTVAQLILSETGGKVIVTMSQAPNVGVGAIKPRDVTKMYGSSEEPKLFKPIDGFYPTMAVECAKRQISFDLLAFPTEFCELVTVGQLCHLTGGTQHLFYNYDHFSDSHRLSSAIDTSLTEEAGYAAIIRVRCSAGLDVKRYHGHFLSMDPKDMDLAAISGSSTFLVELQHENVLDAKNYAYVQCALLYTTRSGSRRVRVHTLKLPICNTYISLFRNMDLEACMFAIIQHAIHEAMNEGTSSARNLLNERIFKMLLSYRRFCSTGTHSGQLLMPDLLKLMPVYCLSLIKSYALSSGTMTRFDDRIQDIFSLMTMPSYRILPYLYPRLYALHNLYSHTSIGLRNEENGSVSMPPIMQLTSDTIMVYGVYLLQDQQARMLYLWIGSQVSSKSAQGLFGCDDAKEVGVSVHFNDFTDRMKNIINYITEGRDRLVIIHEKKDPAMENIFFSNMMEDENPITGSQSYSTMLCDLHKKINSQLS